MKLSDITLNPGMRLLATLTPTAAANVDALNVFTSAYDHYLIVGEGIKPAASDTLRIRLAIAGAADSAANYYAGSDNGTVASGSASTSLSIPAGLDAAGRGVSFQLEITNANDAAGLHSVHSRATLQNTAAGTYIVGLGGHAAHVTAGAVTGLRLYWNAGGNFAPGGKLRIYGFNNN